MTNLLSVRIKISDREYPMKVKPEDEQLIRQSGKVINEKIKSYREQFGIDDKQDLLAMVALDSFIDKLKMQQSSSNQDQDLTTKIQEMNQLLSKTLH